ncbi:DUF2272 domain-containing protein [Dongia soli]|uniref:DUF2272 domain-containing protein n=1 Tax=Dongia soli TaxID=600628 RepID=A0ABU5E7A3_9PROT|nr:DUF2272 domain-containing protein [Dongia soli]MDY0881510.1 DUF2272 domain-containing protein [Dongia soli]
MTVHRPEAKRKALRDLIANPRWRVKLYIVAALFSLAACAAPSPVGMPDPAVVRANLLSLADQEWRAFGEQVIYIDNGRERIDPVGAWEDERRGAPLVAKYWEAVGEDYSGYDCDKPWSAAFISWLMQSAGVPAEIFPPSGLHADYLRAAIAHSTQANALFIPHDPTDYPPKPGDLICASRAGTRIISYLDVPADALLHCDLVVETGAGRLVSIGGNVRNSVSKTVRPIGPDGRLAGAGDRPWFLVLALRSAPSPVAVSRLAAVGAGVRAGAE